MARYIDVDKTIKNLDSIKELSELEGKLNEWQYARYIIKSSETEDVVPIVHGHWITYTYNESNGCDCWGRPEYETIIEHECSYCHSKIITSKIKVYNYCPFCGAKMDGKDEE